jgi:hypothetical protein
MSGTPSKILPQDYRLFRRLPVEVMCRHSRGGSGGAGDLFLVPGAGVPGVHLDPDAAVVWLECDAGSMAQGVAGWVVGLVDGHCVFLEKPDQRENSLLDCELLPQAPVTFATGVSIREVCGEKGGAVADIGNRGDPTARGKICGGDEL